MKGRELTEKEKAEYASFDYELLPENIKARKEGKKDKQLVITVRKD